MSTNFDKNFMTGSTVEASHIQQLFKPLEDLESGAALFSDDTGTANAYKVDFSSGNEIAAATEGQVINFRATNANSGSSTLTITSPSGDLTPIPLVKKGNAALASGDIVAGQVVSALYVEDSGGGNGRFEMIGGVGGSGSGPITATSSSQPQLKLEYDASNYVTAEAQSDGDLNLVTTGNTFRFEGPEQSGPFAYVTGTSAATVAVLRDGRGQTNPYTYLAFNKDSSNMGYVGFANSSLMFLSQGHATGDLWLRTTGTGSVKLKSNNTDGLDVEADKISAHQPIVLKDTSVTGLGSEYYVAQTSDRLFSNIPTGKKYQWSISAVEKMTLNEAGNLGIGTQGSPARPLHVLGTSGGQYQARFGYDSSNYMELGSYADGKGIVQFKGDRLYLKQADFPSVFSYFQMSQAAGCRQYLIDVRSSGNPYAALFFAGLGASSYVGHVGSGHNLFVTQGHASGDLFLRTTGDGDVLIQAGGNGASKTGHVSIYAANNKLAEFTDDEKIGFFGKAPATQQVVTTSASNAQIVTALQNLGLFTAS